MNNQTRCQKIHSFIKELNDTLALKSIISQDDFNRRMNSHTNDYNSIIDGSVKDCDECKGMLASFGQLQLN